MQKIRDYRMDGKNRVGIVNGTGKGDRDGDYTYVGARSLTVIDYVIRNGKEEKEEALEVKEFFGSDHLSVIYRWGKERRKKKWRRWRNKFYEKKRR